MQKHLVVCDACKADITTMPVISICIKSSDVEVKEGTTSHFGEFYRYIDLCEECINKIFAFTGLIFVGRK